MTIAILILVLMAYMLIATEHITNINKATIAMFAGVVGWILFMCTGTDFVMRVHSDAFAQWSDHAAVNSQLIKEFIASNIFIRYAADLGAIALFLLATMNIMSVLQADGCFNFISRWVRTRNSRHLLWGVVAFTFVISANLDNLTTTILMLMLLRKIVADDRSRAWIGSAIVIAATCGGAFTVIGDVTSLVVWTKGAITPTDFSAALVIPAALATAIPTWLISLSMPQRVELIRPTMTYRGDAEPLALWQRWILLIAGIGGLWFIPTFHRITLLPPFLGALCVLGVLWVLHEVFNHQQIKTGQPVSILGERHFQFASIQTIMYFVGVYLCVCVFVETGVMRAISTWCDQWIHNIYLMSLAIGCLSAFLDNVALVLTAINIYPVITDVSAMASTVNPDYAQAFLQNGQYWHLIIYSGCVAGCLLPIGNLAGYELMKVEEVDIKWYVCHILPKVTVGWLAGLGAYFLLDLWLR